MRSGTCDCCFEGVELTINFVKELEVLIDSVGDFLSLFVFSEVCQFVLFSNRFMLVLYLHSLHMAIFALSSHLFCCFFLSFLQLG